MKQLTLSRNSLRLLSQQLESKGDGFSIKQIRLLDRVLDAIEPDIQGYSDKIEHLIKVATEEAKLHPEQSDQLNKELNSNLIALADSEGREQVNVALEDDQYEFVKLIWDSVNNFLGNKNVRKYIIEIDNALNPAN